MLKKSGRTPLVHQSTKLMERLRASWTPKKLPETQSAVGSLAAYRGMCSTASRYDMKTGGDDAHLFFATEQEWHALQSATRHIVKTNGFVGRRTRPTLWLKAACRTVQHPSFLLWLSSGYNTLLGRWSGRRITELGCSAQSEGEVPNKDI